MTNEFTKQNPLANDTSVILNLESIISTDGGCLERYWKAESQYVQDFRMQHEGSLRLIRSFQSLFLETVEQVNVLWITTTPQPELTFYTRFVPKVVHVVQQLFASDLLATHGYPLPAYTLLRNTFDQLVLISAAMQGLTDFFKIDGYDPDKTLDMMEAKKLRVKTEQEVRKKMTGTDSGLPGDTTDSLKLWDEIFDFEVHGAKLSLAMAQDWIQGKDTLHVHPKYKVLPAATYSNRVCEIAWMAHRLLPLLQHSRMLFPNEWTEKWRILDSCFEEMVRHFSNQQKLKLGLAIIDFVQMKFPFTESSKYLLEGLAMPYVNAPEKT